jgi:O-succinylbenzoate synthase
METSPELLIRRYALPFRIPLRTAHGAWTEREGILIRVTGADGRLGHGEIAPIQGFGGRSLDECAVELERLGRFPAREALLTQAKVLPGLRGALVEAGIDSVPIPSRMREHVAVAALLPGGRRWRC